MNFMLHPSRAANRICRKESGGTMIRKLILASACAMAASVGLAETVKPSDVVFDGGAVAESLTGVPGDPEAGSSVMTDRGLGNCVACHAVGAMPDVPFQGDVGPPLDGAGDRWSEAELRGIVANAKLTFEGSAMPSFYKTEGFIRPGDGYTGGPAPADLPPILAAQQIEDVVAYLMTLKE
jgi:sulfur-oxidizing protein SoxX